VTFTAFYLCGAGLYLYATTRGKLRVWNEQLDAIPPLGRKRILDIGCGRGLVAILAALRFRNSCVTGLDLWRVADQSGNSYQAAHLNAVRNRVSDRVFFRTADMVNLPFDSGHFDVVTASMSIHNLPSKEQRRQALTEAVRVLAPSGTLVIVDIQYGVDYARELQDLGVEVAPVVNAGWRMWWSGPWMASTIVVARKPA